MDAASDSWLDTEPVPDLGGVLLDAVFDLLATGVGTLVDTQAMVPSVADQA